MTAFRPDSTDEIKLGNIWKQSLRITPGTYRNDPLQTLPETLWRIRAKLDANQISQFVNALGVDALRLLAPERTAKAQRRRDLDFRAEAYRDPQPSIEPKVVFSQQSAPYKYEQLLSPRAIRLLHLQSGDAEDPVLVKLSIHELDQSPSFDALSYFWGDSEEYAIQCDGRAIKIRASLLAALCTLRHETLERTLWIDAICINQEHSLERNCQVQLMRDVYQRAENVLIWLGTELQDTEKCFQLIDELARSRRKEVQEERLLKYFASNLDELKLPAPENSAWRALDELLWRQWFSRIWIIQELALGQKPYVFCGNFRRPWEDFVDVASFIQDHALSATVHVDHSRVLKLHDFRVKRHSDVGLRTVLEVLITARDNSASDDRDKIFGLLGLLDPVSNLGSSTFVNYNDSVDLVYTNFARWLIERSGNLDCLSAVDDQRLRLKFRLPSWVPDWEVHTFALPFCQLDQFWKWKASQFLDGSAKFEYSDTEDSGNLALVTAGVVIDEISHVGAEFKDHIPFSGLIKGGFMSDYVIGRQSYRIMQDALMQHRIREWEEMAKNCSKFYPSKEEAFHVFIETLIAGAEMHAEHSTQTNLEDHYSAWRFFWPRASKENGKYINELSKRMDPKQQEFALNFMQYHYQAAHRRRFFTTKKGYMGLGPGLTRIGNMVMVLSGGRTPYILKKARLRNHYSFIGEGYVNSIMQGVRHNPLDTRACTIF